MKRARAGTLSSNPPLRSSKATTSCPIFSKSSVTCEPMNPAAPVTSTQLMFLCSWQAATYHVHIHGSIWLRKSEQDTNFPSSAIFPCHVRDNPVLAGCLGRFHNQVHFHRKKQRMTWLFFVSDSSRRRSTHACPPYINVTTDPSGFKTR